MPPTIRKGDVLLEESETETELSSFAYDETSGSFSTSGQAAAAVTSAWALPGATPTLLRDFDPILDELKAGPDFQACQRDQSRNVISTENFYVSVPLQDSNICCSSSTTATPSPEPPSEPPPPLPESGMIFFIFSYR